MKQSFKETPGTILSLVKAEDCQNTVTLLLLGALGAFVVLRSALKLHAYLGKSSRAGQADERLAATGNGKTGQDPNKNRHWGGKFSFYSRNSIIAAPASTVAPFLFNKWVVILQPGSARTCAQTSAC